MNNYIDTVKKDYYSQIDQDINGDKPRELCWGCYECGQEINIDGVWKFIESALTNQKKELIEEIKNKISAFVLSQHLEHGGEIKFSKTKGSYDCDKCKTLPVETIKKAFELLEQK